MSSAADNSQLVLDRCSELGFALCGVCRAEPSRWPAAYRQWIAEGRHGEMEYLARNVELRLDPQVMLPGVASVICVADRYAAGEPDPLPQQQPSGHGRVARYARGDDYHVLIKRRLHGLCDELRAKFPDHEFRACVDTAPVLEREYAERAGLGAIGKHTLLIERAVGSYLLLGEILTTLTLEPSRPADPDPCGTCTRCIDACPTEAITPWSVDGTRCISYLTIEHRGALPEQFHEPIGDWMFGCDICQEVCPHNQPSERSADAAVHAPIHDGYAPRTPTLDAAVVMTWGEDDRREAFTKSSMKRAKLAMIRRNAIVVAGNQLATRDDAQLRGVIERLAADAQEDELVRSTARAVLGRLTADR